MRNAKKVKKSCASRWAVAIFLMSGVASQSAVGAEMYQFYEGVRSMGMGGAYTAIVNDETSLLTNPAGLGKIHDVIFTIADPEVQGSFNDTQITTISNPNAQTPSDLLVLLNEHKGIHWNAKAQVFPSIIAPNIGFGVHGKFQTDAEVNGTVYRLDYTSDYAAVLGFCFRFFDGIVKIGGVGRYMNRTEIHKNLDATVPTIDMNQTASEGNGLAADTGFIFTAPIQWFPTLAATLRDAGNTRYTLGNGMFLQTQTRPAETPQTLDVGFGLFPILGNHTRMSITGDYHDALNGTKDEVALKRVHAGLEFNFSDFFFLRGGYNQGYWTAGLEISTMRFQLQAASYGEEIGTVSSAKEDRRWVAKIAIRF
jgi:hypothetical protein